MATGFQYCLNSSTIKPVPILEKIEIAAKAGYVGIELWHDDIDAHVASGGSVSDIRKAVDDAHVHLGDVVRAARDDDRVLAHGERVD